jgi:hypothetical protein
MKIPEIVDYGIDSSGGSSDEDDKSKKPIPLWATSKFNASLNTSEFHMVFSSSPQSWPDSLIKACSICIMQIAVILYCKLILLLV